VLAACSATALRTLNFQGDTKKPDKGNRIDYSPAADSFRAGFFAGTGRAAAARNAAFFRRK